MLLPVLGQAKAKGHQVTCLNNLRQLGLAVQVYSQDNQDYFPPIQDRFSGFESSGGPISMRKWKKSAAV